MDDETRSRITALEQDLVEIAEALATADLDIEALQTVLATVIDDARPQARAEADQWFDALRHVALRNLQLRTRRRIETIRREQTGSPELLGAMERRREAIAHRIVNFLDAIKRPQGHVDDG